VFIDFFLLLKNNKIPVSIQEYLMLMEALDKEVIEYTVDDFYFLSRAILVKSEQNLDLYDQLFGEYFKGIETLSTEAILNIPEDWLKKNGERLMSPEEMEKVKALGGLDKILERVKELLKEQKERHQGGNKWVGTGGTSPFGAYGYNPEGIRIGQDESRHRRAVKVWDKRTFKNLRDDVELETRNMKMALKKLRFLSREGLAEELDLDKTISSTSKNGGMLDLEMVAQKKNTIKVLLFFDVGGSMYEHVEMCSQLFSAAKYEFKHLEFYYFHNFLYEFLWKDNSRRWSEKIDTYDILNTYNSEYKVIIVGDASMSPYEIMYADGSVEHNNEEAGIIWMNRLKKQFPNIVWLNPVPETQWSYTQSIEITERIMDQRMFPLTIKGIDDAVKTLKNPKYKPANKL
jgi:uncharacterized protein with von Willebrand factor type A (vWA) domain